MGMKFLPTKSKDKPFDIKKDYNTFDGRIRAKLGSPQHPLKLVVKTEEKREELRKLCEKNGWTNHIKVKPNLDENLNDLELAEAELGKTQINEINLGRNDICFCGSGKKYKKCCLNK